MALTWNDVVALGAELPEVEEGIWFRTPALKVKGKSFVRLKEDSVTVVFILRSVEEQEELCATKPAVYYITDHYRGYPAVLARLSKLSRRECGERLEIGYRAKAPKKVLAAFEATRGATPRVATKSRSATQPPAKKRAAAVPKVSARKGTR